MNQERRYLDALGVRHVLIHDHDGFHVKFCPQRRHDRLLGLTFGGFFHLDDGHQGADRAERDVYRRHVGQISPQCIEDFRFATD